MPLTCHKIQCSQADYSRLPFSGMIKWAKLQQMFLQSDIFRTIFLIFLPNAESGKVESYLMLQEQHVGDRMAHSIHLSFRPSARNTYDSFFAHVIKRSTFSDSLLQELSKIQLLSKNKTTYLQRLELCHVALRNYRTFME